MGDAVLVENLPIADIYADAIGDVELLGSNVRLVFFTWQGGERVIVARVVMPAAACRGQVPTMIRAKRDGHVAGLVLH